jgi:amidase
MTVSDWNIKAEKCRKILRESIPQQWLLPEDKLPPKSRLNVFGVPEECGFLSSKELAITACDATGVVKMMASGDWTAEEVTIAFLKRATIGHQLVRMEKTEDKIRSS